VGGVWEGTTLASLAMCGGDRAETLCGEAEDGFARGCWQGLQSIPGENPGGVLHYRGTSLIRNSPPPQEGGVSYERGTPVTARAGPAARSVARRRLKCVNSRCK